MKRTAFLTVLAVALFLPVARTQGRACSLALTAGKWGFTDNGTVVGVGPRVAVGIFTLDAAGNLLDGKATSSLNGDIADEAFSGTYTVESDCTGTINVRVFVSGVEAYTLALNFVLDDHAEHMRGIFTSAVAEPSGSSLLTVIALDGKRLSPKAIRNEKGAPVVLQTPRHLDLEERAADLIPKKAI